MPGRLRPSLTRPAGADVPPVALHPALDRENRRAAAPDDAGTRLTGLACRNTHRTAPGPQAGYAPAPPAADNYLI